MHDNTPICLPNCTPICPAHLHPLIHCLLPAPHLCPQQAARSPDMTDSRLFPCLRATADLLMMPKEVRSGGAGGEWGALGGRGVGGCIELALNNRRRQNALFGAPVGLAGCTCTLHLLLCPTPHPSAAAGADRSLHPARGGSGPAAAPRVPAAGALPARRLRTRPAAAGWVRAGEAVWGLRWLVGALLAACGTAAAV